jgi:hypothetical protein
MDKRFIYGNVDGQLTIVKIYSQVMDTRKKILDERSEKQYCQPLLADACAAIAVMYIVIITDVDK